MSGPKARKLLARTSFMRTQNEMCELLASEQPARSEVRQKLSAMSHKMEQLLGVCEELGDKYQYEGEVDKMAALQVEMDDIEKIFSETEIVAREHLFTESGRSILTPISPDHTSHITNSQLKQEISRQQTEFEQLTREVEMTFDEVRRDYKFDTRVDTRAPTLPLVTSTPYGQGQLMHQPSRVLNTLQQPAVTPRLSTGVTMVNTARAAVATAQQLSNVSTAVTRPPPFDITAVTRPPPFDVATVTRPPPFDVIAVTRPPPFDVATVTRPPPFDVATVTRPRVWTTLQQHQSTSYSGCLIAFKVSH